VQKDKKNRRILSNQIVKTKNEQLISYLYSAIKVGARHRKAFFDHVNCLFLLRHGLAETVTRQKEDPDRSLTPQGEEQIQHAANTMKSLKASFDVLLTSPYLRARQSADIVTAKLNYKKECVTSIHLIPNADVEKTVDVIKKASKDKKNVLVVGHNPLLSRLAAMITTGGFSAPIILSTGTLCKITLKRIKFGKCAELNWIIEKGHHKTLLGFSWC